MVIRWRGESGGLVGSAVRKGGGETGGGKRIRGERRNVREREFRGVVVKWIDRGRNRRGEGGLRDIN